MRHEWMNEQSIYIVLYCVLLYTQSALQSYEEVSLQPPPVWHHHVFITPKRTITFFSITHKKIDLFLLQALQSLIAESCFIWLSNSTCQNKAVLCRKTGNHTNAFNDKLIKGKQHSVQISNRLYNNHTNKNEWILNKHDIIITTTTTTTITFNAAFKYIN